MLSKKGCNCMVILREAKAREERLLKDVSPRSGVHLNPVARPSCSLLVHWMRSWRRRMRKHLWLMSLVSCAPFHVDAEVRKKPLLSTTYSLPRPGRRLSSTGARALHGYGKPPAPMNIGELLRVVHGANEELEAGALPVPGGLLRSTLARESFRSRSVHRSFHPPSCPSKAGRCRRPLLK